MPLKTKFKIHGANMTELKTDTDKSTFILGNVYTPFVVIEKNKYKEN